jgi:fused signal recognition particle receptor
MFEFLKKKIKDSISSIQKHLSKEEDLEEKKVEEKKEAPKELEVPQITPEKVVKPSEKKEAVEEKEIVKEKAPIPKKELKEIEAPVILKETKKEEAVQEPKQEEKKEKPKEKKHRLLSHKINKEDIDELYNSMKDGLIENNVAVAVLEAVHKDLQKNLIGKEVSLLNNRKEILSAIKDSIADVMMEYPAGKLMSDIKKKKPYIILFVGVNGAGKTTTLAKLIRFFSNNSLKVTVAASDTFRAASIEQLEIHTKRLGVEIIKHNYGADPAAVAFDAIKHAKSEASDLVLIDTAGRSDINKNLIDELKKVKRVSKPDLTIFIGDALTGNDAVNQARIFDEEVGIDATILSKADVDKKGGAVISISYITKKPIMFLGTGQGYDDLVPFNKEKTAEFLLE